MSGYTCMVYLTKSLQGFGEMSRLVPGAPVMSDNLPVLTFEVPSPLHVENAVMKAVAVGAFMAIIYDVNDMPHMINLNNIFGIDVTEKT